MTPLRAPSALAPRLILASASPRRREILQAAGIEFDVVPVSIPEVRRGGESPEQFVLRMAEKKAEAALARIAPSCAVPILAADTVVVVGDQTLGKPASAADAREMLRALSGREHRVLTGVCLLCPPSAASVSDPRKISQVAATTVRFSKLSEEEIEAYVATGEPLDKAGAYAIQGLASRYIEWIEGCYFNVVGLPVSLVYRMFRELADAQEPAPGEPRS